MGQKEKLIQRLKSNPRDFTFDDAAALLAYFQYGLRNKGRTSGSRVAFVREGSPPILLHNPHGHKELLPYQVKQLRDTLEQEGLI